MGRLVHHAKKGTATIIFAGDGRQLSPIGAGAPFQRVSKETNASHLSENLRQKNQPEDRDAAHLIRNGKAATALKSYAERGRLVVAKDRAKAIVQLVASWAEEGGVQKPKDCVIFTQTRLESSAINRMCQKERQRAGQVKTTGVVFNGQPICVGDRVLFHEALRRIGIENGYAGTVLAVDPRRNRISVRLDGEPSEQNKKRGHRQIVTISPKDFKDRGVSLFYSATTHKLQGQGVEKAFLLLGGRMTDREMTYVQSSRGKTITKLFVDELNAGENLKSIANAIARSRAKKMAHEIAEHGRRKGPELTIERTIQR